MTTTTRKYKQGDVVTPCDVNGNDLLKDRPHVYLCQGGNGCHIIEPLYNSEVDGPYTGCPVVYTYIKPYVMPKKTKYYKGLVDTMTALVDHDYVAGYQGMYCKKSNDMVIGWSFFRSCGDKVQGSVSHLPEWLFEEK